MNDQQADMIIKLLSKISSQLDDIFIAVNNNSSNIDLSISSATMRITAAIENIEQNM